MMREDGAPQYQIDHFERQFRLLAGGSDGLIGEQEIAPLTEPARLEDVQQTSASKVRKYKIASLKLNGGLGTTMGLDGPKSLLPVKRDETFLSIIFKQYQNGHHGDQLLLMNSFYTHEKIMQSLNGNTPTGVYCFEQGRVPRLQEQSLSPLDQAIWGDVAWCPPGHGQVLDILCNGLARDLIGQGIRYLFISNVDNLGAVIDEAIPEYMHTNHIPWLTEICPRQASDAKGGHVAIERASGKLIVRDSNMTPKPDMDFFRDLNRHKFFSTNNHWLDLEALESPVFASGQDLPLIVNHKDIVNGALAAKAIQMETGLGTAISSFEGAEVLRVSRSRFIPVKDVSQWQLLQSDWFTLQADGLLTESDPAMRPLGVIN